MSILPDSGRGDVFALPDRMPGKLRHVRHSCTVFGGLAGAGEVGADTLQAMANLVPCGYPALTTGNARLQYLAAPTTGAAHGLTLHRGKVVLAQGTGLFVSSGAGACTRLGNVTDTDKRFASFGDLLFILPDGLVYNAADGIGKNREKCFPLAAERREHADRPYEQRHGEIRQHIEKSMPQYREKSYLHIRVPTVILRSTCRTARRTHATIIAANRQKYAHEKPTDGRPASSENP